MKKCILCLALGLTVLISGCEKNNSNPENRDVESYAISINDDYIVFNTIDDYEQIIEKTASTGEIPKILTDIHTSTAKSCNILNDTLYNEVLQSILNDDKIVQIGEWIIKVDMENSRVSVLNQSNSILYVNLVNDKYSDSIYYYSTEDDVLTLLEEGEYESTLKSADGLFCKEDAIGSKRTSTYKFDYVEFELRYLKAGIYFTVYSKVDKGKLATADYIHIDGYCEYKIKARCKDWNEGTFNQNTCFQDVIGNENSKVTVYERTRAVSRLAMRINWSGKNKTYYYENGPQWKYEYWSLNELSMYTNLSASDLN